MPTEYYRRRREIIAQMRATGDQLLAEAAELEAALPPANGNGNGDGDEVAQARTARERARRLGWGGLIKGTGVVAGVAAMGRWLQDNALPATLLAAGGAAAGTLALTPLVAPVLGGGNDVKPGPVVTRTVVAQPPPASPTQSPTKSPSESPSPGPSPAPTTAPGAPAPAPTGGGATAAPTQTVTATATPSTRPPATPPATPPPVADVDAGGRTECALGLQIDPLLGVCILPG